MRVAILGASKVGTALARALRTRGHPAALRAFRRGLPRKPFSAALLVLAVRDGELGALAAVLARRGVVSRGTAVVHVAGALGPEVLAPLRGVAAGVGQAHPLLSFASARVAPDLRGGRLLVRGDAIAVRRARELARAVGMQAAAWRGVDPVAYHAAAGLLANGAAALSSAAAALLVRAGAPRRETGRALGPLLHSVASNVERLGLPRALTGPVRRGDAGTVARHLAAIGRLLPDAVPLYVESARAQLSLARVLEDASPTALDGVERVLSAARTRSSRRARR